MNKLISFIIVLIIILIFYNFACWNTQSYEKYLYGLWTGDDIFCDDASIKSIMIWLGEPSRQGWGSEVVRNSYIIINYLDKDNLSSVNQGFDLTYSPGYSGPGIGKYVIRADVDFDEENLWSEDGKVNICVDMRSGVMKIFRGDCLYAKLYKENCISNLLK
jgi:hypothetical protein